MIFLKILFWIGVYLGIGFGITITFMKYGSDDYKPEAKDGTQYIYLFAWPIAFPLVAIYFIYTKAGNIFEKIEKIIEEENKK